MFTFKKENRLLKSADFKLTLSDGEKAVTKRLVIVGKSVINQSSRLGLIVSKRSIGNAVQRNLIKRRLREIFRNNQDQIPSSLDIVIIARSSALSVDSSVLKKDFLYGLSKLISQLNRKKPVKV